MLTEKSIAKGLNSQIYQLDKQIGAGGEGTVYTVAGAANLVLKVYQRPTSELEEKLKYMVSHPAPKLVDQHNNTIMNLAWPRDVIYDSAGQFAGYVMPRVAGGIEIFEIERGCTSAQAKVLFPNYTWRLNVLVARNLAAAVMILHQQNYIIGDMNCKNMLVNADGSINMLDTDSFDITDPAAGKHYKCCVGTEEYLAPELQGVNLSSSRMSFSTSTDDFALAIHIFRLLMNNRHPFTCRQLIQAQNSSPQNQLLQNVAQGKCPYIHKYPDFDIPLGAPTLEEIVPDYIRQDFIRTFDYTETIALARASGRTTAAQWLEDLKKLLRECDNSLVRCNQNLAHFYLRDKGACGMCKAQKRYDDFFSKPPKPVSPVPPASPVPSPLPVTPAKPKPWKKILTIAAVAALVVFCFAGLLSKRGAVDSRAASQAPSVHTDRTGVLGIPMDQETLSLLDSEPESYEYFDGSRLLMYFNVAGEERCRMYRDATDNLLYVFVADYNDAGDITTHRTYDGEGTLLRTDQYTYNAGGNCVEVQIIRGDGRPGRTITRTYDQQGRRVSYEEKVDDGTVLDHTETTYGTDGWAHSTWTEYGGNYGESISDENGNQISYTSWNQDGSIDYKHESLYDSEGRQTQSAGKYSLSDGGWGFSTEAYQYNSKGKIDKILHYKADGSLQSTQSYLYGPHDIVMGYSYDYSESQSTYGYVESIVGTYVYRVSVYSSDSYFSYRIALYDVMGNLLRSISVDKEGNVQDDEEYFYDDYDQEVQRYFTDYHSDGSKSRTRYVYGEKNYDVTITADGEQKDLRKYFHDYDSNGRLIKETAWDENEEIISWTEYTRDYRGWVTKKKTYDADGKLSFWVDITYDENGEPNSEYHFN